MRPMKKVEDSFTEQQYLICPDPMLTVSKSITPAQVVDNDRVTGTI